MFRALGIGCFVAMLCFASAFVGLALYDIYAQWTVGDARKDKGFVREIQFSTTYFDENSGSNHIIGLQRLRGASKSEWIQYPEGYDVASGKFGFFTDHPVDRYPDKGENEFRIILVGGSGAQGHGGRTNDDMLYKTLERMLRDRLEGAGIRVHIVNLAMAGAHITTNRDILRAYGHVLKPDMILAYIGVNDTSQLMSTGHFQNDRDAGYGHPELSYPWYIDWLVEMFPTAMLKKGLGRRVAQLLDLHGRRYPIDLVRRHDLGNMNKDDPSGFFTRQIVPRTIDSLKAIKREFCGVPIVLVRQIWGQPRWANDFLERVYNINIGARPYDYWWEQVQAGLPGYFNEDWHFFDAQDSIWGRVTQTINYDDGVVDAYELEWTDGRTYHLTEKSLHVHLDSQGHYLLSDWLAPQLVPIVAGAYAHSRTDVCESNFRR